MTLQFEFDANYLARLRAYIASTIVKAKYRDGYNTRWATVSVTDATVRSDRQIEAKFYVNADFITSGLITEVQLYDGNNNLVGQKLVNIRTQQFAETGIYVIIRFSLLHIVNNSDNTGQYDVLE